MINTGTSYAPGEEDSPEWDAWREEALKSEEAAGHREVYRPCFEDDEYELDCRVIDRMAAFCQCCSGRYVPHERHVKWFRERVRITGGHTGSSACAKCEAKLDYVPEVAWYS